MGNACTCSSEIDGDFQIDANYGIEDTGVTEKY